MNFGLIYYKVCIFIFFFGEYKYTFVLIDKVTLLLV